MTRQFGFAFFTIGFLALALSLGSNAQTKPTKSAKPSYAQVQAIFTQNCIGCHGDRKAREGVKLTDYKSVMAGGEMGAIVVAKKPEASLLLKAINGTKGVKQMPFRRPPLSKADIALIEAWIKAGASSK